MKSGQDSGKQNDFQNSSFPVVGIGASAGGLGALKRFMQAVAEDSDMAYVVIQHLDPEHKSLMAELLGEYTSLPVAQVTETTTVEANHVYVIPPNAGMTLAGRSLHLEPLVMPRGMRMPIDDFFVSLATECREMAVAVILSGSGADGSKGGEAVKAQGGLVLAQLPEEAEFSPMPENAIRMGVVDRVLSAAEMPELIADYCGHVFELDRAEQGRIELDSETLEFAIVGLREQTGHDFSGYKRSTLMRRVCRRMGVLQIADATAYAKLVRESQDEAQALLRDLLIGVTSFFRERDNWNRLVQKVIRPMLQEKQASDCFRVWVPGCATGEEAYTIAILLQEEMERADRKLTTQIFATDIDEHALTIARAGRYPKAIAQDLSDERLDRFFSQEGDFFVIDQHLRDRIVFSRQNAIMDPPFSQLDLLSCRNMLIYIDAPTQRRLFETFHFALKPTGALFLGQAETVGDSKSLFASWDGARNIYRPLFRHNHQRTLAYSPGPTYHALPIVAGGKVTPRKRPANDINSMAQQIILSELAPAAVLINEAHEVVYYCGDTSPFLRNPVGTPSNDVYSLVREGLAVRLRSALHQAAEQGKRVCFSSIPLKQDEQVDRVTLTIVPMPKNGGEIAGMFLVSFELEESQAVESVSEEELAEAAEGDAVVRRLQDELKSVKEDLRDTIEALESSNEELKASNEEVMSMNEELQSSNEELETSKEELQSLNEELTTVNSQLEEKVKSLEAANADLENFVSSTNLAIIFLDRNFNIRRYTPAAAGVMRIRSVDVGRCFNDIALLVEDLTLGEDAAAVLADTQPRVKIISAGDGVWFQRRALPYMCSDGELGGVTLVFENITEIQHAHKAIEESKQRLNAALDAASMGTWDWSIEKNTIVWDGCHERLFGFAEGEFDGSYESAVGRFHPDDIEGVEQLMAQARRDRQVYEQSYRVVWPDGSIHWMMGRGEFSYNDQGEAIRMLGVVRDITARKEAELALAESEKKYRKMLESITDCFFSLDEDMRVTYYNNSAALFLGKSAEEVVGKKLFDAFPEARGSIFEEQYTKALRDRIGVSFETYFDVAPLRNWYRVRVYPFEGGISVYFMVTTEEKEAEARLDASRKELLITQRLAHVGSWSWNIQTGELDWSDEMYRLFGLTPENFPDDLPAVIEKAVHHEDRDRLNAANQAVIDGKKTAPLEYRVVWEDGSVHTIWAQPGELILDENGKPLILKGFAQDVSERRQLEGRLNQVQKMDAVGQLAGGIAHDFNNQLTGILAYAEILVNSLSGPEERTKAEAIVTAASRASDLTAKLLAFARKGQFLRTPVDIHAVIGEVVEILNHSVDKRIQMHQHLRDRVSRVDGDPTQLQNALLNLALNGCDAMPEGGTLTFSTELLEVGAVGLSTATGDLSKGTYLVLEVADTGTGISPDDLPHVFEPFYTTKEVGKGTGMGLASVYGTVQHHGGGIDLNSEVGKGTVFRVYLPLSEDINPIEVTAETVSDLAPLRALVVDDEEIVRELLKDILEDNGHSVALVEDGKQAVDYYAAHQTDIDVVILDLLMPEMNGRDCFHALKQLNPDVKVLLSSGFSRNQEVDGLLEAGAGGFLQKPYRWDMLQKALKEVLGEG